MYNVIHTEIKVNTSPIKNSGIKIPYKNPIPADIKYIIILLIFLFSSISTSYIANPIINIDNTAITIVIILNVSVLFGSSFVFNISLILIFFSV